MAEGAQTLRRAGGAVAGAAGTSVQVVAETARGAGWSSPTAGRKLVLLSMFGLMAIAFYRARRPEADVNLFRRLWGVGVLGIMLSIVTDFAPMIGGPFALLVLLGSLTNGGDRALQNALSNVGRKIPAGGGAPAPAPARSPAATARR